MARVALALGSGGARGYAHVGVIDELIDRGHEIVAVSGASMGALVGGMYAAGGLTQFAEWARSLRARDVWRLVDPQWRSPGAIAIDKVLGQCREFVGDVAIADLDIPYTAVATDLIGRREIWFRDGPLFSAIRASIAIPGLITPSIVNGRILVDGGLLNPIPVEPLASTPADLRIAVSLQGERALRGPREDVEAGGELTPDLKVSDVTSLAMDAVQGMIARYRTAGFPPDVLVTVPYGAARTVDFHRAAELIELGRQLTAAALDEQG